MNPQKDERRFLRRFRLKALGPTQVQHVSVSIFALRVRSRPRQFGCSSGREGGGRAAPPAEYWSKTTTGSLCSHLCSAQSHIICSVNADQQPVEAESHNVFLIALFFNSLHDCAVTVLPQHLAPHTDTYFLK